MEGRDPPEDASIAHLAHVPAASALPASPAVPAVGVPVPLELAHASPAAGWQLDFLKGFISGQVVVFLLLWFLVRLVFLRNADEADADMRARRSERSRRRKDDPRADAAARYLSSALILGKVYGDDPDRPEESCDWLSVLLAQLVEKYRRDGRFRDYILGRIDGALNAARPGWLGAIVITEFSLGEEYPLIKGAKIRPCRGGASVVSQ